MTSALHNEANVCVKEVKVNWLTHSSFSLLLLWRGAASPEACWEGRWLHTSGESPE